MLKQLHKNRGGFTLVEIMIVVAIIALLAAIAVPGFLRARKRSQATTVLNELRLIDGAKDQYAIENNRLGKDVAQWAMLTDYFKPGSDIAERDAAEDIFENAITLGKFDELPKLSADTFANFTDVVDVEFWGGYYEAAPAAD